MESVSKHRNSIYGVAALLILVVHSKSFQVWTGVLGPLNKLFTYGGLGVPMFAFLSGMGIYISLQKNSLKEFYRHRIIRTFIPYLLIAGFYYFIVCVLISHSFASFFYELSTVSFWLEHRGPWYIAWLIPVYGLIPFYARWVESGKRGIKIILSELAILLLAIGLNAISPAVYDHLSLLIRTTYIFLIGYFYGEHLSKKKDISIFQIGMPIVIYIGQAAVTRIGGGYFATRNSHQRCKLCPVRYSCHIPFSMAF